MKLSQIKLKNFRGYQDETVIDISDLTVFVGKNDVGKSTILEALYVFFNEGKGIIKVDKDDINKDSNNADIEITIIFENHPNEVIIDSTNETTLESEYLLNKDGKLEVIKRYIGGGKEKVFIKAYHPTNPDCKDLLLKKQTELKDTIQKKSIECDDKKKNAVMRKAIWENYKNELSLEETEIDVTKEDAKNIWEQLNNYMPLYSLFQSDRKNSDGDSEIQDPMKLAVQEIVKSEELQKDLNQIAIEVTKKLNQVAKNTLEKLREMNEDIANSLNPVIPPTSDLKWADVFKNVSISGDQDIPINKRGSGVKRLVLLNFFRAEAERRKKEKNVPHIIYAIEEPETSQHPNHQRQLIDAFSKLSKQENTQIILTTHSPPIVKMMDFSNLRLVEKVDKLKVRRIEKNTLPFPSLNEVNFLAFGESDENYHNELYGFIEGEKWLSEFEGNNLQKISYTRKNKNGEEKTEDIILSEYIRHQIHHPENDLNERYSDKELQNSIKEMREFISEKKSIDK